MHPDWARSIRDQCREAGVPFFFKQWGGVQKKKAGRVLDGITHDEFPDVSTGAPIPLPRRRELLKELGIE